MTKKVYAYFEEFLKGKKSIWRPRVPPEGQRGGFVLLEGQEKINNFNNKQQNDDGVLLLSMRQLNTI